MKLTSRERILMALFPSVLVVGAYAGIVRPTFERRIASAEQRTEELPASRDSGPALDRTQRELDAALRRSGDVARRAAALSAAWSHADRRASTARELSALFARHHARVERSSPAEEATAGRYMTPSLRSLERTLADLGGEAPAYWRLDLRCGFAELTAALGDLERAEGFVLPISLALEPMKGPEDLSVSLWLLL